MQYQIGRLVGIEQSRELIQVEQPLDVRTPDRPGQRQRAVVVPPHIVAAAVVEGEHPAHLVRPAEIDGPHRRHPRLDGRQPVGRDEAELQEIAGTQVPGMLDLSRLVLVLRAAAE